MLTTRHPLLPTPSGALVVPADPPLGHNSIQDSENSDRLLFSLIVPTYNESQNIAQLVQLLTSLLDPVIPNQYELIVVDDDSPDRTWEHAQVLMTDYPQLKVMRRQEERGLSTAVVRGWQAAQGRILGVIDADLQHPPDTLLHLLAKVHEGTDLAVASRHVEGGGVSSWSAIRRFLSRGAQLLGLVILPRVVSRVSDPMSGYFLVRRSAIAEKVLKPVGYKILLEVLARGSVKQIAEVGYVFNERQEGESKVTWKQYVDYLVHLVRLRISCGRVGKLGRQFNFPFQRFLRFGLVGLSGVIVDMGTLYLLFDVLGLGLTRSAILAAELAIINNFYWNDIWTFSDLAEQQRRWRLTIKRFLKFNIVCVMGLILKILLLNLFFNGFAMNAYVANLIAIALVTFWNFWINLKLSWRVTQVK